MTEVNMDIETFIHEADTKPETHCQLYSDKSLGA